MVTLASLFLDDENFLPGPGLKALPTYYDKYNALLRYIRDDYTPTGATGPTGTDGTLTGPTGPTGVTGAEFDWIGAWETVAYSLNDCVEDDGNGYVCIVSHTATAGSEPGSGTTGSVYWDVFVEKGATGATTAGPTGPTGADSTVTGPTGPTGGSVGISGVPVNDQIAVWTGGNDIEGGSTFLWTGARMECTGDADFGGNLAGHNRITIDVLSGGDSEISWKYNTNSMASMGWDNTTSTLKIVKSYGELAAQELMAEFDPDGAVGLYYDNAKKIETTSTGAAITGNLRISGVPTGATGTGVVTGSLWQTEGHVTLPDGVLMIGI